MEKVRFIGMDDDDDNTILTSCVKYILNTQISLNPVFFYFYGDNPFGKCPDASVTSQRMDFKWML